ncbi:MAG: hypothetical protein ACREBE_23510, partial [bacterium]
MIDVCVRCGQSYRTEDNRDDLCVYHPGWVMDYDRVGQRGSGLPGDFWDCCSGTVETTPADVPGCARGPHVEAEPQPERRLSLRWPVERAAALGRECAFDLQLMAPDLPRFDVPGGHTEAGRLRE